jgi:hypothetical protein
MYCNTGLAIKTDSASDSKYLIFNVLKIDLRALRIEVVVLSGIDLRTAYHVLILRMKR